jgi:aconitate hydratase
VEIPYHPARVLMQDFTGVPAVVDLAAMRDASRILGEATPPRSTPWCRWNWSWTTPFRWITSAPKTPRQKRGPGIRAQRRALRLAQVGPEELFDNFKVVPPNSGICHQVNLENLGRVIISEGTGRTGPMAYPDTLVGTDSHTTMIDGIGVMGWGVGGIEAEAVMLGQPYYMSIPQVIGVKLTGDAEAPGSPPPTWC